MKYNLKEQSSFVPIETKWYLPLGLHGFEEYLLLDGTEPSPEPMLTYQTWHYVSMNSQRITVKL